MADVHDDNTEASRCHQHKKSNKSAGSHVTTESQSDTKHTWQARSVSTYWKGRTLLEFLNPSLFRLSNRFKA